MCLINYKKINLSGLKKPVTCYKVFQTTFCRLDSPLYDDFLFGSGWEVGKTRSLNSLLPSVDTPHNINAETDCAIYGNAFHTCCTLSGARKYKKWLNDTRYDATFAIAKCEVPLDSLFLYKGTAVAAYEDEGVPGYVSESLKVVKLIK